MLGFDDAALALLASGAIATAGQLYTNRQNLKYQEHVNDVNWQIAERNNATQIDLANSAHQREVQDLRAAGLNPILSSGGNGAASPNLSNARLDAAQIENPLSGLASSAKGLSRFFGQLYQSELRGRNADADTAESNAISSSWEASNASVRSQLEREQLHLENQALHNLTHKFIYNPDKHVWEDKYIPGNQLQKLTEEGIISDAKQRSNANWRANLSSFTPFVSPAAINNSAGALSRFRFLWRTR